MPPLRQEDCRARPLTDCDADCRCAPGIAYAIEPAAACIPVDAETKPIVCNGDADIDGSLTTALDPEGRLWLIGLNDLPEGWSFSPEPVDLAFCNEGA